MIVRTLHMAHVFIALAASAPVAAAQDQAPAAPAASNPVLTPKDAGARFGQALGAAEVCYGSKVTGKANGLEAAYSAADQEAFKAQAAKIFDAWHKVKNCADQFDPNRCKIIMDKSCLAAEAEIGPSGNVLPGLVEFIKHQ